MLSDANPEIASKRPASSATPSRCLVVLGAVLKSDGMHVLIESCLQCYLVRRVDSPARQSRQSSSLPFFVVTNQFTFAGSILLDSWRIPIFLVRLEIAPCTAMAQSLNGP